MNRHEVSRDENGRKRSKKHPNHFRFHIYFSGRKWKRKVGIGIRNRNNRTFENDKVGTENMSVTVGNDNSSRKYSKYKHTSRNAIIDMSHRHVVLT